MEEIHESFVGFPALLQDWNFTGDCSQPAALAVIADVLGRSVAARLDADLPEEALVTEVNESHQSLGSALLSQVKHHRVGDTCNIQVRGMDAQPADFPHIRRPGVGPLGGELGEYRKGQVFVIAAYGPKSAN